MASARRTGTNEDVDTYNSAGGADYTALATWESATDNDNVTGTISPVLEGINGGSEHEDRIGMASATNNSTYFRIIRPQAGSFHSGVRDTGFRLLNSTADAPILNISETNTQIQDVVFRSAYNSASNRSQATFGVASNDAAYVGCIGWDCQNLGAGLASAFGPVSTATNRTFSIACLAENTERHGWVISSTVGVEHVMYNCASIICGENGFSMGSNATLTLVNCLGHGSVGVDFTGSVDAGSNNASEDATALGTSPRTSQTFTFVNAGSFDYHLSASDAGAKDFGTSLAADATYPFNDDIDRQTFSTWDIGMDEPAPSSSIGYIAFPVAHLRPAISVPGLAR